MVKATKPSHRKFVFADITKQHKTDAFGPITDRAAGVLTPTLIVSAEPTAALKSDIITQKSSVGRAKIGQTSRQWMVV
jgi:hypothetical protein